MLGVKEDAGNDGDKFLEIISTICVEANEIKINNVMQGNGTDERTRPVKVTLKNRIMQGNILKNAKNLKDESDGSPYKRVYFKRDTLPEIKNDI